MKFFSHRFLSGQQENLRNLAFITLAALVSVSCTRPQLEEETALQVALPQKMLSEKLGAQSAQELMLEVVILNVTGSGLNQPIYLFRQSEGEGGISGATSLTIPRGSDRLIQALAVYSSPNGSGMEFYYGDLSLSLNSGSTTAAIGVSRVGNSAGSGQISGRYLSGADTGPTGLLEVRYTPPGKPSMRIESSHMVNGWFSAFGLMGVPLDYVVNGINLFGGSKALDEFQPEDEGRVVVATIAESQRMDRRYFPTTGGPGVEYFQLEAEDAQRYVWGYWGSGAGTTKICAESAISGSSNFVRGDATLVSTSCGPVLFEGESWIPFNANGSGLSTCVSPTNYRMAFSLGGDPNQLPTAAHSVNISTLALAPDPSCGDLLIGEHSFEHGKDGVAGFSTPLLYRNQGPPYGGHYMPFGLRNSTSGSGVELEGMLMLPGTRSLLNTYSVYRLPSKQAEMLDRGMNTISCQALSRGEMGAQLKLSEELPADAETNPFSMSVPLTATEKTDSGLVLCFSGPNSPVQPAVLVHPDFFQFLNGGNGGGGGTNNPPQVFANSADVAPAGNNILENVCTAIVITGKNGPNEAAFQWDSTFTMNSVFPGGSVLANFQFFTDDTCTNPLTTNASIPSILPHKKVVFVKGLSVSSQFDGAWPFQVTVNSPNAASFTATSAPVNAQSTGFSHDFVSLRFPVTIPKYECIPLAIFVLKGNDSSSPTGFHSVPQIASGAEVDFGASTDLQFFADSDCASPHNFAQPLPIGKSMHTVFFRYSNLTTTALLQPPTFTSFAPQTLINGDPAAPQPISVVEPGALSRVSIRVLNNLTLNQVTDFTVRFEDSMGRLTKSNYTSSLLITSSNVRICYVFNDCNVAGNALTGPISLYGLFEHRFKIKALTSTGGVTVPLTFTIVNPSGSGTPAISGSAQIRVENP